MEKKMQQKREYQMPKVKKLGDFGSLTQGPYSGTIDQIAGGDGGFQMGS